MVVPRNPSVHGRAHASGSKQARVSETSGVDKFILHEGVHPESIQSETIITKNVSSKNPSRSVEGMSDVCTTQIIAETLAFVADMVAECDTKKHSSPVDNVEYTAFVPSKSPDDSSVKRSKSTSTNPKISVVNNPPPTTPRVKVFYALPSSPVSGAHVEKGVFAKDVMHLQGLLVQSLRKCLLIKKMSRVC